MINEPHDETKGRTTQHSDAEYEKYWRMTDEEKQNFIRESYKQRNPTDIYATSRDFHVRELEIQAILQGLGKRGAILDLGCGNGYTLISVAKKLKDWPMVGIDFADNLVEGAKILTEQARHELQSEPQFIQGDAIKHLKGLADESTDYVITERFVQNLPNRGVQTQIVEQAYRILKKGGRLLMCEASEDGFNNLNQLREKVGLSVIPATSADNISAIRIVDPEFEKDAESRVGFKIVKKLGMSNYMLMSRVLQPLMTHPLPPRFDSSFNQFARLIQEQTEFMPGFGSNVLWVLEK